MLPLSAAAQCPYRPAPGTPIGNPIDLYSQNGVLSLNLSLQSDVGPTGFTHYCYVYMNHGVAVEAPTLRLNPGDRLDLNFTNNISVTGRAPKSRHVPMAAMEMGEIGTGNPCLGGIVTATTTNVHFHGLNVPPVCHGDEVVKTIIPNNGIPFGYSILIPADDPPGLFWYHPHPHGFSAPQVYGGAAGSLIIEGSNPLTGGLVERVLTIRRNVDAQTDDQGQFTLNFEPCNYPARALPVINMVAGQREFWRVLNASTNGFLSLQVFSPGVQQLLLIARDGVPLTTPVYATAIDVPPAGRVEFIVPALTANTPSYFLTQGFDTGPIGDPMPPADLASLVISSATGKSTAGSGSRRVPPPANLSRFAGLAGAPVNVSRSLYFSELNLGTNGPGEFFITVDGQKPKLFDAENPPAVVTKLGSVEKWTISNRTGEPHAFHMHQLHFLVTEINGKPVANPELMDTVTVPPWSGTGPFPSVTVKMQFLIAGKFVYHCHILDHEDGGMMATIFVAQ